MKNYIILFISSIVIISCKQKKKQDAEIPISAISIIKGQTNHLDTSIYEIKKLEIHNRIADSSYIQREDLRTLVSPFLALPDIADKNYSSKYTEERFIDAEQNTLNITSTAIDSMAEIQKQIIIVNLEDISNGKVQSIYIDRYFPAKDSVVEQKLFWEVDKFFSIGTITTKNELQENTAFLKVSWQ